MNKKSVTQLIQEKINEKGIQMNELAKRCGMTRQNLNRIINSDDLKVSNLKLIAYALGESPAYFFDGQKSTLIQKKTLLYLAKDKLEDIGDVFYALRETINSLDKPTKTKLLANYKKYVNDEYEKDVELTKALILQSKLKGKMVELALPKIEYFNSDLEKITNSFIDEIRICLTLIEQDMMIDIREENGGK